MGYQLTTFFRKVQFWSRPPRSPKLDLSQYRSAQHLRQAEQVIYAG
jgi:hypothetical protein